MYTYLRRLGARNKFHEVSIIENVQLPDRIEEELRKYNASSFDLKVAKLCFVRHEKGNKVHLVSNDSCFLNIRNLLEKYDIYVKSIEEFKGEYLSPSL
jgi:aminopeptidase-like protein